MDRLVGDQTKSERLAIAVRDAIHSGELAPGALYSAKELAETFGVSRTPVREALLKLADAGLVRIERNRGVRILKSTNKDISELFTLRLLLEPPATGRAAMRDDFPFDALDEALARMRTQRADPDAFFAEDRAFHDVILRASGNKRLADFVAELRHVVTWQGRRTVPVSRDVDQILAEHEDIADAVRARDVDRAVLSMREHLLHTADLLIGDDLASRSELHDWLP